MECVSICDGIEDNVNTYIRDRAEAVPVAVPRTVDAIRN